VITISFLFNISKTNLICTTQLAGQLIALHIAHSKYHCSTLQSHGPHIITKDTKAPFGNGV